MKLHGSRGWPERILSILDNAVDPLGVELGEKYRKIIFSFIVLINVPVLGGFGIKHLFQRDFTLGAGILFLGLFLLASIGVIRNRITATPVYRINILLTGFLFFYLLVKSAPTGYMGLWLFVYPPVAFYMLGAREGLICSLSLLALSLLLFSIFDGLLHIVVFEKAFKVRFLISLAVVTLLSYSYEIVKSRYQTNLLQEKERLAESNAKMNETLSALEQTQLTLRESDTKYRDLVERANDGIVLIQDARIVYINPRMAEIVGGTVDEILNTAFIEYIEPSERPEVLQFYRQRMEGRDVKQKYETKLRHAQGHAVDVEINAGLIPFQGRKADLALVRDISERKQIEMEIENSRTRAENASRAKSEFLANMSHELRTPLNHIIGFTEMVVDQHFGQVNEVQADYLSDVLTSSKHLLSLINDILDLSKVEAGKLELNPSEVHLPGLLTNSFIMIKEKALKQGIQLVTNLGDIPESITADERKVKQILYNLLSNAVKFTPAGGHITLTAMTKNSIDASARHRGSGGRNIEIGVADTGIGLAREDLDRIFNPFEQVEISASRKYQGTGLGLSLTKKLVELHRGTLWVESEGLGRGSRFSFTLPIAADDSAGLTKQP